MDAERGDRIRQTLNAAITGLPEGNSVQRNGRTCSRRRVREQAAKWGGSDQAATNSGHQKISLIISIAYTGRPLQCSGLHQKAQRGRPSNPSAGGGDSPGVWDTSGRPLSAMNRARCPSGSQS